MAEENEDRGDDFAPSEQDLNQSADEIAQANLLASTRTSAAEAEAVKAAEDAAVAGKDKLDEKLDEKKDDTKVDEKKDEKVDEKKDPPVDEKKDDKKDEKKDEPTLPLSRHKQILERERALRADTESRLEAASRAGTKAQADEDTAKDELKITELEEKYAKQLADGEVKDATATMREIRKLDRSVTERQHALALAAAEDRAVERVRWDNAVQSVEAAFPILDPKHVSFDADKVKEVLELQGAFRNSGLTAVAALQRAVGYVLRPTTAAQERVIDEKDDKKDEKKDPPGDVATAEARRTEAIKKGVEAAGKQPPNTAAVGLDSDKGGGSPADGKTIMKMSFEDFSKLGDEELAKMRGDAL